MKQKCQSFPVDAFLNLTVIIQYNIVMKRNQRIHVQYTWYSGLEVRPLQSKGNVMCQLKMRYINQTVLKQIEVSASGQYLLQPECFPSMYRSDYENTLGFT